MAAAVGNPQLADEAMQSRKIEVELDTALSNVRRIFAAAEKHVRFAFTHEVSTYCAYNEIALKDPVFREKYTSLATYSDGTKGKIFDKVRAQEELFYRAQRAEDGYLKDRNFYTAIIDRCMPPAVHAALAAVEIALGRDDIDARLDSVVDLMATLVATGYEQVIEPLERSAPAIALLPKEVQADLHAEACQLISSFQVSMHSIKDRCIKKNRTYIFGEKEREFLASMSKIHGDRLHKMIGNIFGLENHAMRQPLEKKPSLRCVKILARSGSDSYSPASYSPAQLHFYKAVFVCPISRVRTVEELCNKGNVDIALAATMHPDDVHEVPLKGRNKNSYP